MKESEDFFKRTEALAKALRVSQRDLPGLLGISGSSYFGYRTGRNAVSVKAWRKLEALESRSGIEPESKRDEALLLRNDAAVYHAGGPDWQRTLLEQLAEKDRQIGRLLALLEDEKTKGKEP